MSLTNKNQETLEIINLVTLATGLAMTLIPSMTAVIKRLQSDEPATLDELRAIVADVNARSARIQALPD